MTPARWSGLSALSVLLGSLPASANSPNSATPTETAMSQSPLPILPQTTLTEGAWVLFESFAIHDENRVGNWRFRLDSDGCFRLVRNTQPAAPGDLTGGPSPQGHWNQPFPEEPDVCLAPAEVETLLGQLNSRTARPSGSEFRPPESVLISDGEVERWTIHLAGKTWTIVLDRPQPLETLPTDQQASDWARESDAWTTLRTAILEAASR